MCAEVTRLNIRLFDGTTFKANIKSSFKLRVVAKYIIKKAREKNLHKHSARGYLFEEGKEEIEFFICTTYPKAEYDPETETRTVGELFGKGANLVIKDKYENPKLRRGHGSVQDGKIREHGLDKSFLKGENYEDRLRYEKEKREKEAMRKKEEHEKKKLDLLRARMNIEGDKLKRVDKVWITKDDVKGGINLKKKKKPPGAPTDTKYDDNEYD